MVFRTLAIKYFSDKTKLVDKLGNTHGHCYDITYDSIFEKFNKNYEYNILEIGIGLGGHYSGMIKTFPEYSQGASLKIWAEYFMNSNIYGWDIYKCNYIDNRRIKTYIIDATNKIQIDTFFNQTSNITFDIIIDDGSHDINDQVNSFMLLYNKLNINGVYIIEDILENNIELFQNLNAFPDLFKENIINKNFSIKYYDTRKESGNSNDFIITITRII